MNLPWTGLASGAVFGVGLVVSGMADPQVVLSFLAWGPGWDPALLFVMGGALVIVMPGFAWSRTRGSPLFAPRHVEPMGGEIDTPLMIGALVFGLGWGLAGFCPGPAVVAAGLLQPAALLFVPAMLAGGWVTTGVSAKWRG